jgi:hypothetical protein
MTSGAFAQAKTPGHPRYWGQILGTGCGTLERRTYALEATKKGILLAFYEAL